MEIRSRATSRVTAADRAADRDLAARCASGDRAAQRDLFARVKGAVHHRVFDIVGSNRGMEELLQASFVAIFRAMHGFRGEASLDAWCASIAAVVAHAHLGAAFARRA